MRKKIIAENERFVAIPFPGIPGEWEIFDGKEPVGYITNGTFGNFRCLTVGEMLIIVALMLRIHGVERVEEQVLKTKNEENGG